VSDACPLAQPEVAEELMLKYGVVGAIALAVLVAAMWDGNKKKKEGEVAKVDPTKVETTADTAVSGDVGTPVAPKVVETAPLTPPAPTVPPVAKEPVAPAVEVIEKYQVHPKDTLRSIARNWLGDEKLAEALLDFNKTRIPDARHLNSHLTLTFPRSRFAKKTDETTTKQETATSVPAGMKKDSVTATDVPAGDKKYVVKEGDTLYGIAARELGKGSRFGEIKTLNNLTSDMLKKGQTLQLPQK
jgi:nucleoid-associated protein YgaU